MAARASALSAGGCERSYPRPEVRGSGLECQAVKAQERLRGATLRPRSVATGRSYRASEVRGGEGQGRQRSGVAAGRRHPASEVWAAAERSYPASEVRGGREETSRVRGPGQRLGGNIPHPRSGTMARRSYPVSKGRGCQKELSCVRGRGRPGGDTPCLRAGAAKVRGGEGQGRRPGGANTRPRSGAAGRRHPASEGRGGEGQGRRPGGDTLCPRSAAAGRKHPASEVRGNCREELSCSEGRGGREKPPRTLGATPSRRPGPAAGRSILRSGGCAGPGGLRGAIPR